MSGLPLAEKCSGGKGVPQIGRLWRQKGSVHWMEEGKAGSDLHTKGSLVPRGAVRGWVVIREKIFIMSATPLTVAQQEGVAGRGCRL
ncbi:hypothetical protein E2C01_100992 [Portunus trituberculatus]|uniref:Uncharacterized protein n=1 Tax=Portunus trituberculatus TaxID=210409 RepID=A0A5B7KDL1_PORTR|nr:hypothetical protein [Portunus trituberculatus]